MASPKLPPEESLRRRIGLWLALCLALVSLMVIVGGLTRLTESGLSMVEWQPATILPPMDDAAWAEEFTIYKTSPQFKKSFPGMSVDEFRQIYWLEYSHRLLGKLAGLAFLLPFLFLLALRRLPWRMLAKLGSIALLFGVQGGIGWYMVKSGLINDPHVSPYRLSLHLATGFLIFGLILWQLLSVTYPNQSSAGFELPPPSWGLKSFACVVLLLVFLQVILGAFVAGLHAGLTYNTFPQMDGQWIPEGLWPLTPWYLNLFEDVTSVQFDHRIMAYLLTVAIPLFWFSGRNSPHVAHLLPILFSVLVVQFLLGVLTLLFVVPIPLASLHQGNALLLFGIAVAIAHRLFIPLRTIAYGLPPKSILA